MMKSAFLLSLFFILCIYGDFPGESIASDQELLLGTWQLDMSPQDKTDANFAMMKITKVEENSFEGEFYRKGVKIKNGQINTQLGIIYGALISGDNSGTYYSTFYLKDGMLHGSTHAVNRNFLSVWTATKND